MVYLVIMAINSHELAPGIVKIEVDSEILDEGLLFYINEGLLMRSGYRLTYDRLPDGKLKFYLIAAAVPGKFEYDDAAKAKLSAKWSVLQQNLRPR